MPSLLTYWNTLRHLKPIQLYGRIRLRLVKPRINLTTAPLLRTQSGRAWVNPTRRRASMIGPESFCFLNETHNLTEGWDNPTQEKLWRYNLHYFDDLNALDAVKRVEWQQALLLRWVRENTPTVGTGWNPFPTSLRIVNWIKWALVGNVLPPECIQSLAVQSRWLLRRLETHLMGNHLFANAKALVFTGLFFEGTEANNWLEKGLRILEREIPEQILSDGGQFERSTMYHALATEDMLDLYNMTTAYESALSSRWRSININWWKRIIPMRVWLKTMCHPDGEISFFNDATSGISPAPIEIEQYAARLELPNCPFSLQGITHLADSGYIRVEQDNAVAILDVAPIGPDYLPGHAHADTLSFELSLFKQRVFVNSGISCYGNSIERLRQRGTTAHNTVVVNEKNSSEVWSSFRVARRAQPQKLEIKRNGRIIVRCAHNGYQHLPGNPDHSREWLFGENALVVEDRITGKFGHAEARFHLHPSVKIDKKIIPSSDNTKVLLQLPGGHKLQISVEGGVLRNQISTWHSEFGLSEPNICIAVFFNNSMIRTHLKWASAL